MGKIEKGEIIGYEIDGEIYCLNCIGKLNKEFTEDNIITKDDREGGDHDYFCDECKTLM